MWRIFQHFADGLAALPTLIKAYKHPETELAWPWIATCIGIVLTLLTLKDGHSPIAFHRLYLHRGLADLLLRPIQDRQTRRRPEKTLQ
jgi:hypothetical protein